MRIGDLNGEELRAHLLRLKDLIDPLAKLEFVHDSRLDANEVIAEYSTGEIEVVNLMDHTELICRALSVLPYLLHCALEPSDPMLEAIRTVRPPVDQ